MHRDVIEAVLRWLLHNINEGTIVDIELWWEKR